MVVISIFMTSWCVMCEHQEKRIFILNGSPSSRLYLRRITSLYLIFNQKIPYIGSERFGGFVTLNLLFFFFASSYGNNVFYTLAIYIKHKHTLHTSSRERRRNDEWLEGTHRIKDEYIQRCFIYWAIVRCSLLVFFSISLWILISFVAPPMCGLFACVFYVES